MTSVRRSYSFLVGLLFLLPVWGCTIRGQATPVGNDHPGAKSPPSQEGLSGVTLKETETRLARDNGINEELLKTIKQLFDCSFTQLQGRNRVWPPKEIQGVGFEASPKTLHTSFLKARELAAAQGCIVYFRKLGLSPDPTVYALVKKGGPFKILKIEETDGINYDLNAQAIIRGFKAIESEGRFEILGANYHSVHIRFLETPKRVEAVAKQIARFCPDAAPDGKESIDDLIYCIKNKSMITLWWD